MDRTKKLAINSILFTIGNFGSKFLVFLMLPLYTYKLTPSDFGVVDLVQTTISLMLPIVTLSIFEAVLRFSLDKSYSNLEILSNGLYITHICTIILIFLGIVIQFFINYSFFVILILILQTYQSLFSQYSKAIDKIKVYVMNGILLTFTTALSNVIFLVLLNYKINGYLISLVIGLLISNIYLIFSCRIPIFVFKVKNIDVLKSMLLYSIPLIPNSIAWFATNSINRYFVVFLLGTSANGIFAVANKIPTLLAVINSIFFQSWQLSAIEEYNSKDRDTFYSNVLNFYFRIMFISSYFILIFSKLLMKLLVSNNYFESWQYIPFLLLGIIYSSLSGFIGQYYIANGNTKGIFYTTVFGSIINTILTPILIVYLGLQGAGVATALSFLIMFLVRLLNTRKFINTVVEWKIFLFNHLIFFFLYLSLIFIDNYILKFTIDIFILFIYIFFDKSIIKLVKNLILKRRLF